MASELSGNSALATFLLQHNMRTLEDVKGFIHGTPLAQVNPLLMADMDKASLRLAKARENKEHVMLFGDYDVDGTTAVSVGKIALEQGGWSLSTYIPDRYTEGYGLSQQGIDAALERGATLMITLDCGIKAHDLIGQAQSKGIDVIVTDHHQPGKELPPAFAVVDPMRNDCEYPEKSLSGCGVGYMLWRSTYAKAGLDPHDLDELLDLVAVSIGADMVPILGLNRWMVRQGLQRINERSRASLQALLQGRLDKGPVNLQDVVFSIGPRINAAGRMHHGHLAVDLLCTPNPQLLKDLGQNIEAFNAQRRLTEQQVLDEALTMAESFIDDVALVLCKKGWHKGVLGIVAQRLVQAFHKPVVVLTEHEGVLAGSARTADGLDLYQALDDSSSHLTQFGGHRAAAGMTLLPKNLLAFRQAFNEAADHLWPEAKRQPSLRIDALLSVKELSVELCTLLERLEPFGMGFPSPLWGLRNVRLQNISKPGQGKHLKADVVDPQTGDRVSGIGFNMGHLPWIEQAVDVAVHLEWNHFRGSQTRQLRFVDLQPHGQG
ncbi:MAG: single-stranded-DNA-specific exonuclease RecJ [Flavobacteriales bacterium]|nr:single-stranded-DNA-specific exonuclease RecJ [Flavobacteriales bacterium]MDG1220366.1 single-stranded-DNA-specific exonuclease RecJ [Schleiferiaceae bacterium]MDO7691367.1 single-stranded-DNA-specific exonuclease RecJ [Schleiferiaceae bacterium]